MLPINLAVWNSRPPHICCSGLLQTRTSVTLTAANEKCEGVWIHVTGTLHPTNREITWLLQVLLKNCQRITFLVITCCEIPNFVHDTSYTYVPTAVLDLRLKTKHVWLGSFVLTKPISLHMCCSYLKEADNSRSILLFSKLSSKASLWQAEFENGKL
jgi:hypothetical protein